MVKLSGNNIQSLIKSNIYIIVGHRYNTLKISEDMQYVINADFEAIESWD